MLNEIVVLSADLNVIVLANWKLCVYFDWLQHCNSDNIIEIRQFIKLAWALGDIFIFTDS